MEPLIPRLPFNGWRRYSSLAKSLFGLPSGRYEPAVADGFYLLLPPLTPGPHTLTFGGSGNLAGPFTQSVVYHLTVGH
jgi:hypothetical protein